MSGNLNAASSPTTGTAGGEADGLDKAFDAAFGSLGIEDTKFAPGAMDKPIAADTVEKPVDTHENAETAKVAATDGKAETPEEKAARLRDEKGRFAPGKPATEATAAAKGLSAPANWDAQRKDAFGKLTPDAQKIVLDIATGLEGAHTKRSTELAEDRKFAEGIRSLITDEHREQLRRANMNEAQGVAWLLKLNDAATRDFPAYVRWAVANAKVDPRAIFPELAGASAQASGEEPLMPPDPHVKQLQETIQSLAGRVQGFERERHAEAQQRRAAELGSAEQVIARFKATKGEDGATPRYPHFDRLGPTITKLLAVDPDILAMRDLTERLEKAYDLAVYRDPELRAQVIDDEVRRRATEGQRAADVAKARRAQPAVRGGAPVANAANKPKSLDEALMNAGKGMGLF